MSSHVQETHRVVCRDGTLQFADGRLAVLRETADGEYRVLDEPLSNVLGVRGHGFLEEDGETVQRVEVHIAFAVAGVRFDTAELGREPLVLESSEDQLDNLGAMMSAMSLAQRASWRRSLSRPDLTPPHDPMRPDLRDAYGRAARVDVPDKVATVALETLRPDEYVLEIVVEKNAWVILTSTRLIQMSFGRLVAVTRELPLQAVQGVVTPDPGQAAKQLVVEDGLENHVIVADGDKRDVARCAEALRMMLDLIARDGEPILPPWNTAVLSDEFDALARDLELGVVERSAAERQAEAIAMGLKF